MPVAEEGEEALGLDLAIIVFVFVV